MKKAISLLLSLVLSLSCFGICAHAANGDNQMRFNSDGKFKIVVFADCQDNDSPYQKMIDFMGMALDYEKPDLVVFTGDNVHVGSDSKFKKGATAIIQPLIDRDIPYAYTYGNHDADSGVSKEYQYSVYQTLGRCLTYNADDSIYGYGNCNIPIYSSVGNSIAFNLWIIDSNMYNNSTILSGYDSVHADQLDWFVRTDEALEQSQGHKVNSIVFQHIALPEIYNLLKESSSGSKTYLGKTYAKELNSNAHGYLGEFPCPPSANGGEFDVLKSRGDVLGVVTGHDHSNSFVGTWQGIDFIQMPGMSFRSYGDDNCRGYGVIELDERDTSTYSSYTVKFTEQDILRLRDYEWFNEDYYHYESGTRYISDLKFAAAATSSSAKNEIESKGYTVVDFDLNKGGGGSYIYMGYKTTYSYADAIKDIRFYISEDELTLGTVPLKINGKSCDYINGMVDLNKGAGGNYVYALYSKDGETGSAITNIGFSTSTSVNGKICGDVISPMLPADLNDGTIKHSNAIYCYTKTNTSVINESGLIGTYDNILKYLDFDEFSEESMSSFRNAMNTAAPVVSELKSMRATNASAGNIPSLNSGLQESCAKLTKGVIDGDFFYGLAKPTFAEEIPDYFNTGYVDVYTVPTCRYMGTGSKIQLVYDGGEMNYTTVNFGDVNGDGWYDGQDAAIVSCIAGGILNRSQVEEAVYLAADCNHDGNVDENDVAVLNEAGVLLSQIDQTKSHEELLETSSAYSEYLELIDQNPVQENEEVEKNCFVSIFEKLIEFIKGIFSLIRSYIPALY